MRLKESIKWILASASPRRKELFAELVEEFEILPSTAEEVVERVKSKAIEEKLSDPEYVTGLLRGILTDILDLGGLVRGGRTFDGVAGLVAGAGAGSLGTAQ